MDIPVHIQPVPGKGFVATAPAFGWSAEGATEDEALQAIRQKVTTGTAGVRVAEVKVPPLNPLMVCAGELKDHPLQGGWRRAVAEYRTQIENDPDR
jgi:hypothetical protein